MVSRDCSHIFRTSLPLWSECCHVTERQEVTSLFDKCLFSTGVLLVDRLGSGVWLMHSTPQFPYRRNINNFWPPSGMANAQTFICVTLPYNQFAYVGKFSTPRSIKDMKSVATLFKLLILTLCCPQVNISVISTLSPLTMMFQPTSTHS